jgi:hypothetical protein
MKGNFTVQAACETEDPRDWERVIDKGRSASRRATCLLVSSKTLGQFMLPGLHLRVEGKTRTALPFLRYVVRCI